MKRRTSRLAPVALFVALFALAGANWPQFRGPGSSGVSSETGIPLTWNDTTNVVWRTALPGYGASSPIVVGERIFVTGYSGFGTDHARDADRKDLKLHVVCIDAGGKIVWDRARPGSPNVNRYGGFVALHGYASATPASDGKAVYASFGSSGVVAYDLSGELLWTADVGKKTHNFGTANSPVLFGDLVIINASVESGAIVALDKKSGKEVWRTGDIRRSWNTPVLVKTNDRTELVVNTEPLIKALDPETGKLIWTCEGMNDYICPSVIAHDGIVYAIGSRSNTAVAIRAGGDGDVTESHRLWKINKGANVTSPVLHEGYLYWVNENRGVAYCVDAKSGEIVYEERLDPRPGRIYASPVAVDGKLYYVSRENGTYVLPAKPEFAQLAHNELADDKSVFNGSPAVMGKQLLLRSDKYLYCVGKKNGKQ
jgi:hypothetical protein